MVKVVFINGENNNAKEGCDCVMHLTETGFDIGVSEDGIAYIEDQFGYTCKKCGATRWDTKITTSESISVNQ